MSQSPLAASIEALRASANDPFHGKCTTFAPNDSAISTVRSVEPVSTTIISSTTSAQRLEAAREHLLLVLHDHAQRERQVLHRAGAGRDPAGARGEAARAGGVHAGQPRLGAGAQAGLLEVRGRVRVLGVEPQDGPEDVGGGARLAELVEQHAQVVQEHRLARLLLERIREAGGGGRRRRPPMHRRRRPVGEHAAPPAGSGPGRRAGGRPSRTRRRTPRPGRRRRRR